jgi:hypothetical protein
MRSFEELKYAQNDTVVSVVVSVLGTLTTNQYVLGGPNPLLLGIA